MEFPYLPYTVEPIKEPIGEITHRVIGHTLGEDYLYVATIGTLEQCKVEARRRSVEELRRVAQALEADAT